MSQQLEVANSLMRKTLEVYQNLPSLIKEIEVSRFTTTKDLKLIDEAQEESHEIENQLMIILTKLDEIIDELGGKE